MQNSELPETMKRTAKAFAKALGAALSEISTSEWEANAGDEFFADRPDLSVTCGFRFVGEDDGAGDVIVGIHYDMIPRLGFRDLNDDNPDLANAQKSKLLAALQGQVSKIENALWKDGSVSLRVELVDNPVQTDQQVMDLVCQRKSNGDDNVSLFLCLSPKLAGSIDAASATPFEFPQAATAGGANLDLVMDVELNVTLRFGQRQLALRDVLELASGSVVELDRQVDEPIELILDGRVVARGEAVIIDGNYGMRVTQVLQPFVA